ncbi:MAG: amidohydrolase family protein [Planctomycetota bacterium]|nr:amidohydrolase family protein [Planctomycetota bacterium]
MKRPSRRAFLGLVGAGGAALAGARWLTPRLMRPGPVRPIESLSPAARALVESAFAGVDASRMWDCHAHLVGIGTGGTGCAVSPEMQSHLHPIKRFQFDVYMAAAGVRDLDRADQDYLERLLALHRGANPAGRLLLMAFDRVVGEDGVERPDRSTFYTPNELVLRIARQEPDVEACVSIHPYRPDALQLLDAAFEAGARAVKWLPNAMGIDPAARRCDGFYRRLAELGLPLITHTGREMAVDAAGQELGNPLRLRRPLDHGVRVVAAHCASLGSALDLDAEEDEREELACFDLFMRLMSEKQYEQNLFGEISALTQVNRSGRPLRELLIAEELHPRLVNGSDYPLPAIGLLFSPRYLDYRGYIDADERRALGELFDANPLLFDFVAKRCLEVESEGRVHRFAPVVFETGRLFA